jgi:hypothetical protein
MGTTISAAQWLNVAINVFLPILVALVTKRLASGGLKAFVLLLLSAISGYLISILDAATNNIPFDFSQGTFTAVTGFIVAIATHYGIFKPALITGSSGAIQRSVPGGIGAEKKSPQQAEYRGR